MTTIDINRLAADIYAEIVSDVEAEDTLYVTDRPTPDYDFMLRSFSELHDFTDANMYLVDALGDRDVDDPLWNAVADAVDALLKAKPVMLMEGREECCVCGTMLANSPDGEAGHAQGAMGWMPVCSDACTTEFYAQGGGILEANNG